MLVVAIAFLVGWILGAPIGLQGPNDGIFRKAMAKHRATVIDNDRVDLALVFVWSQRPAKLLAIHTHSLRRASEHDAPDVRAIKTLGQHHAIRNDGDLALGKLAKDRVTLILGCCPVDVFAGDT